MSGKKLSKAEAQQLLAQRKARILAAHALENGPANLQVDHDHALDAMLRQSGKASYDEFASSLNVHPLSPDNALTITTTTTTTTTTDVDVASSPGRGDSKDSVHHHHHHHHHHYYHQTPPDMQLPSAPEHLSLLLSRLSHSRLPTPTALPSAAPLSNSDHHGFVHGDDDDIIDDDDGDDEGDDDEGADLSIPAHAATRRADASRQEVEEVEEMVLSEDVDKGHVSAGLSYLHHNHHHIKVGMDVFFCLLCCVRHFAMACRC